MTAVAGSHVLRGAFASAFPPPLAHPRSLVAQRSTTSGRGAVPGAMERAGHRAEGKAHDSTAADCTGAVHWRRCCWRSSGQRRRTGDRVASGVVSRSSSIAASPWRRRPDAPNSTIRFRASVIAMSLSCHLGTGSLRMGRIGKMPLPAPSQLAIYCKMRWLMHCQTRAGRSSC